jgi:hypothetical protein
MLKILLSGFFKGTLVVFIIEVIGLVIDWIYSAQPILPAHPTLTNLFVVTVFMLVIAGFIGGGFGLELVGSDLISRRGYVSDKAPKRSGK